MSARHEQAIWKNLHGLCAELEDTYGLVAVCSAGVLLLSEMESGDREKLIARARNYEDRPLKKPVQDAVTRAKAVRLSTEKSAKSG